MCSAGAVVTGDGGESAVCELVGGAISGIALFYWSQRIYLSTGDYKENRSLRWNFIVAGMGSPFAGLFFTGAPIQGLSRGSRKYPRHLPRHTSNPSAGETRAGFHP